MSRALPTDISTRHFPDLSDTSFQIPNFRDNTDLLTTRPGGLGLDSGIGLDSIGSDHPHFEDDNDDGVGSGMESDPFTTPLRTPQKCQHSPLRLSEITPRRERVGVAMAGRQEGGTGSSGEGDGGGDGDEEREKRVKEENSSVRHMKRYTVDDMFERRKRNNNLQMGIDLSSKSSARLKHNNEEEMEHPDDAHTSTISSNKATVVSNMAVKRQIKAISDAPKTTAAGKPKPKRTVIDKDAGIVKHKSRVVASTAQPKSILKPSKPPTSALPPSTLTRALTTASHTPQAERPKWGDVVAEVQQTSQRRESFGSGIASIGGGLIDVLVMYGEKLKGSFGFSSSASKASTPQANSVSANAHSHSSADILHDDDRMTYPQGIAGPSSEPLRLSDLSPSKPNRPETNVLTLSPSKRNAPVDKDTEMGREQPSKMLSPVPQSRKRPLAGMSNQESKKSKFSLETQTQSIFKRVKTTRTGPAAKRISKPMPLGSSRAVNKAKTQPQPKSRPVRPDDHRLGTATSTRNLKDKSFGNPAAVATQSRSEQHLALQPGPALASDVYRQRAMEKTQKGRERTDAQEKEKKNTKAGVMPHFSKPAPAARPAVRPTIPAAFTFHSDARAAQRNAEHEEKRKTWSAHATHQALPMPDFAAIHAAQAETLRSKKIVPVLPTDAPSLMTTMRAKEREKLEAERREREKAIEEQLEIRERERAEEEEREYREARKRTVPKAHEVPEWYKDSQKARRQPE